MSELQQVEEGFYPNLMEIKQIEKNKSSDKLNNFENIGLFNSFCLSGEVLIKKQPFQSYDLKPNIQISKSEEREKGVIRKRQKFILDHPYNIYTNGSKYLLVYNRQNNQPIFNQFHYIKSDVILFNQQKYQNQGQKYKLIKSFQKSTQIQQKSQLVFDSKFQCGNLRCSYRRIATDQYHCFLDNDTNTRGYNQWFYFSIRNVKAKTKYLFKILNLKKRNSFFKHGYKPAIFSLKKHEKQKNGWYRDGFNINYTQSPISISSLFKFYCLSFQLQFQEDDDFIMIASNLPYSYSKLIYKMKRLQQQFNKNSRINFKMQSVCKTLCNNDVPQITICSKNAKKQKMIIFMARQHPCQTISSYLMERILMSLLLNTTQLQYLLQNYVIVVYPMINVDGVIYGNSRCDISGVDLNRRWREPSKIFHPQIYQIKKKISNFQKKFKIQCCFDLHGHSKLYNSFCYSCKDNIYTCRILPYIIQSMTKIFYFPSCTFGITRGKQTTARATIYKIIKNENVLTIQNSYYGYKLNGKVQFWQLSSFDVLASSILNGLNSFLNKQSSKFCQIQNEVKSNLNQLLNYQKHNIEESGSESDPSGDQIDFQTKINTVFSKKYALQAKSFLKQKQLNQVHHKPIFFKQEEQLIQKIHQRKQQSLELINKEKKIKIKKIKNRREALSNQLSEQKVQKFIPSKMKNLIQKKSLKQIKQKRTISYSIKKSYKLVTPEKSERIQVNTPIMGNNKTRLKFKNNKKVSLLHFSFNQKQIQKQQSIQNLYIKANTKQIDSQMSLKEEEDQNLKQFFRKFEKFIPNNMNLKIKGKLSNLQESIYRDDQTHILNTLMENKKKLEQQKLKREIELSTCVAERQGKIKKIGTKEQIIDFKKFKENQKLKIQMKKVNQNYNRYMSQQKYFDFN